VRHAPPPALPDNNNTAAASSVDPGDSMHKRNAAKGIGLWIAGLLLACVALTAAADPVYYTLELKVDPAKSADFLSFMKVAAADTRNFKGCQYFAILVDESDPGRVLFYEIWDSKADHEAYRAWRTETKFADRLASYLAGPTVQSYFAKYDD
jgi:heme oxygenase (mycobilin-producing)